MPPGGSAALAEGLRRVAGGERAALAEVYRATSTKLFGVCLRILPDRGDAEDALQETYLNVWRNAGRFDEARGSAIAWLVAVARNRSIDRLRGRKRIANEPLALADDVPEPSEGADLVAERTQENDRLRTCLDTVGRLEAAMIQAAFFEGSTYSELAERAATPLGTVKSRVRRALLKLRECLQP